MILTNANEEAKEKGFDKYGNMLVAATRERAIARLIMDTNYPPYTKRLGLIVHPEERIRLVSGKDTCEISS